MPFEHGATTQWGRWLRAVFAGRPPGVQVVGQEMEDSLRGVVQVADMRHLAEPIRWAQAATRRQQAAVAAQVSRVELHCQSPGGLWIEDIDSPAGGFVVTVADAPLTVPDRVGITDFGNIDTVSLVGVAAIAEANPGGTIPVRPGGGFDFYGLGNIYVPPGKVLVIRAVAQNVTLNVGWIGWREIPAPR